MGYTKLRLTGIGRTILAALEAIKKDGKARGDLRMPGRSLECQYLRVPIGRTGKMVRLNSLGSISSLSGLTLRPLRFW